MPPPDLIRELMNQQVVLDVSSLFVYAGTLAGQDDRYLVLEDADVHDLRDTSTTRELYVVKLKRLGINPNRSRVLVRREEIVSLSALDAVIA